MPTVKIRLRELMREKAIRDGRHPEFEAITQEEVAKAVGIGQGTMSSWVRGTVERMDRETIAKMCIYFDCQLTDLLQLDLGE